VVGGEIFSTLGFKGCGRGVAPATSRAGGCHRHPPASSAARKTSPATSLGLLCSRQPSASPGALAPPAAHRPAAQGWLAPPQTHTKTGPYRSHVAFLALFQTVEEMRIIAVISVAGHAAIRHPTGLGFIQQRQGKLRFSLKLDRSGDVRLLTPRLIRRPLLEQVQPDSHRPGPRALGVMTIDRDLAVSHLARRPSILARHPDRVTPALLKPCIIKDEHPSSALGKVCRRAIRWRLRAFSSQTILVSK